MMLYRLISICVESAAHSVDKISIISVYSIVNL